ncbi:hypothetical protein AYJ54_29060 [Bradyrhizobium centrolobii]|uniref:Uncharacterized protein n=1 Tax=Bradyrhizobium centrolobii TaxID=1505087 RepID=A0A176YBK1_9BRAD|nr:hypothetical protein [Bradyrhizobium centrolobii]OAF01147.1 hypothetical protein AYJ54_29060 [Bradyrhizobium centrolobii]
MDLSIHDIHAILLGMSGSRLVHALLIVLLLGIAGFIYVVYGFYLLIGLIALNLACVVAARLQESADRDPRDVLQGISAGRALRRRAAALALRRHPGPREPNLHIPDDATSPVFLPVPSNFI